MLTAASVLSQTVYEVGTFVSLPAGKHVNHSYYSTWEVYFATEDGVLIYSHNEQRWLDPITASDGLSQYPALIVWHDQEAQDVWIITPDYVFIYDQLSAGMTRHPIPREPEFQGTYSLGHIFEKIILTASNPELGEKYSTIFFKGTGAYETWGANSDLALDWDNYNLIGPSFSWSEQYLPAQAILNGQLSLEGRIFLDGYPAQAGSEISDLTYGPSQNEMFLGTYGMGVYHRDLRGRMIEPLPFGLLSPDVMSLHPKDDELLVGGRAGLTTLKGYLPSYNEALRDPSYDYSFISDVDYWKGVVSISARGGVFIKSGEFDWKRLVSKQDLASKKIYSHASGDNNLFMIGTERNAYLYHASGSLINSLFSGALDWPVFNIEYRDDVFYLATYFGLYLFDAKAMKFTARVSSSGTVTSPHVEAAIDPIYELNLGKSDLWAASHRGLLHLNLDTMVGNSVLAPATPFKPRGVAFAGDKVWVGTEIGAYSYNPKLSSWRLYTQNDGIISNFITDIVAIGDYIWLGTNLGLTRVKWKNLY